MKRFVRRAVIGSIAGGAASAALIATAGHVGISLLLGVTIGAAFAASTGQTPGAYLDNVMAAGALGVPLWGILSVITLPLLSGQMPEWSAAQMRERFPALVGWVLYGVTLGLLAQALNDITERLLGPEPASQPAQSGAEETHPDSRRRIRRDEDCGVSGKGAGRKIRQLPFPWSVKPMPCCSRPCSRRWRAAAWSRATSARLCALRCIARSSSEGV